jgi:uncharacterized protein (TIGR03083 family)
MGLESAPSVERALEIQRDGVRAIQRITGEFDEADWLKPTPCEGWTAVDLAGHVLTAIDNWHVLLDDAEAGVSVPRFGWDEMDAHFEAVLASLPVGSGPDRIGAFAERAEDYFERVAGLDPDLPSVPAMSAVAVVPITVGLFAWVGGTEWQIHAWDFAQVIGQDYRTEHARMIYNGTMAIRGRTPGDEDPWEAMLSRWRQHPGVAH